MDSANEYPYKRRKSTAPLQPRTNLELSQRNARNKLCDALALSKKYPQNPHRASTACDTCRLKKVKCDEGTPVCTFCKHHSFRCEYQLQGGPSRNQLLSRLLAVEEKIETLLPSKESDRQWTELDNGEIDGTVSGTKNVSPSPAITPNFSLSPLLPTSQRQVNASLASGSPSESLGIKYCREDKTPDSYQNSTSTTEDPVLKAQYLKRTPFSCEESRPPMPNLLLHTKQTQATEIIPLLEYFFEYTCPLFPIICDQVTYKMASVVAVRGFQDDFQSCLILLMVALSKAYRVPASSDSGLPDFQRSLQILNRLSIQFTMEYAQVQILAALFMFKKGRLLSFWSYLHAGCIVLYTMIRRDESEGRERSPEDTKTTQRLYWISYNLERDLLNESDSFPRTLLFYLEDRLPLPLGCDESGTINLKSSIRTTYTFFLAEMSLKAIVVRILAIPDLEYPVRKTLHGKIEMSPLIQELKTQIDTWEASLPTFLEWSPEARKGVSLTVGIRLKLLYWFARFSLFKPLIIHFQYDLSHQLPFLGWACFRDGLLAGLNMIKVSILEESDIDVIMGSRLISTISLLKGVAARGCFAALSDENLDDILQDCINMLWRRLAYKSEWITCRLQSF